MGHSLVILYRISAAKRADDLSGTGAKLYGGRWNAVGNPVVYAAQNISLAMLEKLVHADKDSLQSQYSLTCIQVPQHLVIKEIKAEDLPVNWRSFPRGLSTAELGNAWLNRKETPVLKVPSAVNSYESNFLLNPLHSEFSSVTIEQILPLSFDTRFR